MFRPAHFDAPPFRLGVRYDDVFLNNGRILLRNLGGGSFVDVSATHLPGGGTTFGTRLDADLDGDLDVVGGALLWLNDGTGRFTAANARGPGGTSSPLLPRTSIATGTRIS